MNRTISLLCFLLLFTHSLSLVVPHGDGLVSVRAVQQRLQKDEEKHKKYITESQFEEAALFAVTIGGITFLDTIIETILSYKEEKKIRAFIADNTHAVTAAAQIEKLRKIRSMISGISGTVQGGIISFLMNNLLLANSERKEFETRLLFVVIGQLLSHVVLRGASTGLAQMLLTPLRAQKFTLADVQKKQRKQGKK